jgi:S-DNA-T family DNA segregation ATPase FtsK/SpoIIIE
MQARAAVFAGRHREHRPTIEHPFIVVLVDEVAFLTAYLSDRAIRDRIKAALATLTTQGRAVGYSVIAALQDPRKEVMNIRTCSRTGSRCASMSPSRWTWSSATELGTAAPPPT